MTEVQANLVADFDHAKNPGDFYFAGHGTDPCLRLAFLCPCGCGVLAGIRVQDDGKKGEGSWAWNLSREKPTCTPSILIYGGPDVHWHGYLTDGVFRSC